jgi:hypothetical protein
LTVRARNPASFGRLSETMRTHAQILEFSIEPTGD